MAKPVFWRAAGRVLLLLGLVYGGLVLNLYFNQAGMLYLPGYAGGSATPADVGLDYRRVSLTTEDGLLLDAWHVRASQSRGVILFCHGNAGNISNRLGSLKIFHQLGFSTLIFDYRGYGNSQGSPSEQGTYLDAEAAWQYLLGQGVKADEIVIMGRSLGAAVAAELAYRHKPKAVVLESAFTSVPDVAAELYPFFPVRLMSKFEYGTLDHLRQVQAPVLIVHSREDEIIPFSHGQRLYEAANEPRHMFELRGGHNDGIYVSGVDYYQDGLDNFFQRYVNQP